MRPPFQIDGNFGATAGIAEMLVQSQAGFIQFLPALPDQWSDGSFSGFCVRGGGAVSAKWKNKKLEKATLRAKENNTFKIKIFEGKSYKISFNRKLIKPFIRNGIMKINLQKGQTANMTFE